jgi:hypothetical protein
VNAVLRSVRIGVMASESRANRRVPQGAVLEGQLRAGVARKAGWLARWLEKVRSLVIACGNSGYKSGDRGRADGVCYHELG